MIGIEEFERRGVDEEIRMAILPRRYTESREPAPCPRFSTRVMSWPAFPAARSTPERERSRAGGIRHAR
jgi:hypothetical protein